MDNNTTSKEPLSPNEIGRTIGEEPVPPKPMNLSDLQANILKPHGRNHVWCLFITFNLSLRGRNKQKIKAWISKFAENITSTQDQIDVSTKRAMQRLQQDYPGSLEDGGLITSFNLNNKGYKILGYKKPRGKTTSGLPREATFWRGLDLQKWKHPLYDQDGVDLENNYKNEVHALITLADDSIDKLIAEQNKINTSLVHADVGRVLFIERGNMIRQNGKAREHFGYHDGITNPPMLDHKNQPTPDAKKYAFDNDFGSYLVFLKIEQNVLRFNNKIRALSQALKISPEAVGAQVIGRTLDGVPISHLDSKGNVADIRNEPDMSKCPFHAHARKAGSWSKNIVRRGIPYGSRRGYLEDEPEKNVGLLFMSFQKSIEKQFEVIQERFNDHHFPYDQSGIDPIMGQSGMAKDEYFKHTWVTNRNNSDKYDFIEDHALPADARGKVVKIKGGEYFHAPTISFLKGLFQPPVKLKGKVVVKHKELHGENAKVTSLTEKSGRDKLLKKLREVIDRNNR